MDTDMSKTISSILFQIIQKECEFQQPYSTIIEQMELISDKISVLSNSIIGPNEIIKSSTLINSKKRTNLHTST